MADPRIVKYREATLAMIEGQFPVEPPVEGDDEVARLGEALRELSRTLEARFHEIATLQKVTEKINAGLLLDEVLDYVYESFRPIMPYDRIGFSLLEEGGKILRAHWARSEAKE
ncbi:MAG: hypothetical protein NTW86_01890, partial [Candidatus Sumerlaeota bacterium]|nr:hypothetical protein [Candidatus Sumerlaeota bacterium]